MSTYDNPFTLPGQWFKGNTHTHTQVSDGDASPEDRCAAYRQAGYDFLTLTDHFQVVDVAPHTRPDFLVISGMEVHPPNPHGGDKYHIVAINVQETIDSEAEPNHILQAIRAQGGMAILAHPYWCGHTINDYSPLTGYAGIEVYNHTCATAIGKGVSESHWDDVLDRLGPAIGLAVDDTHHTDRDAFGGWIMVKAAELTTPAILDAMTRGAFYSTMGPEIKDIRVTHGIDGPVMAVTTSPVRSITFKGRSSSGQFVSGDNGDVITEASHTCKLGEKYVRVEIEAIDGKKAWSNPFFVAEMMEAGLV